MDALAPDFLLAEQARGARQAARALAVATGEQRNAALLSMAKALRDDRATILEANARDLDGYRGTAAFGDRLRLNDARLEAMASGIEAVARLPDPLGRVEREWTQPNGLQFRRVSVPLGVIGMIYESRPNVGADAASLCLKSGNAVLLRGGSESAHSARAINAAIARGLKAAGLPEACVQSAPTTDRAYVGAMLRASGAIDLLIPRGGKSLVERVLAEARVPVLAHAEGLCHSFVHASADPEMAVRIVLNAKMRRTGICGATETLLVDAEIAPDFLPRIVAELREAGCAIVADKRARALVADLDAADDAEFATEWLDAKIAIAVVDGVDGALEHIARFGSLHTEAIIAEDPLAAEAFIAGCGSAVVMWNASTQFCDGGEFGFGAEIGIATGKMHARGPVGLEQLTTYRYEVRGNGQVRG